MQFALPDWTNNFDIDQDAGRKGRRDFFTRYQDQPTKVIGSHFADPGSGHTRARRRRLALQGRLGGWRGETFDYVIVGAGSAGCVLANRLSAEPGVTVCLLEAGGRDSHPFIHVPALVGAAIGTPSLGWGYWTRAADAPGRPAACRPPARGGCWAGPAR